MSIVKGNFGGNLFYENQQKWSHFENEEIYLESIENSTEYLLSQLIPLRTPHQSKWYPSPLHRCYLIDLKMKCPLYRSCWLHPKMKCLLYRSCWLRSLNEMPFVQRSCWLDLKMKWPMLKLLTNNWMYFVWIYFQPDPKMTWCFPESWITRVCRFKWIQRWDVNWNIK